jgi:hypothetical protein
VAVTLGTNDYFGVPFPLVVADRFFHIFERDDGKYGIDIFRWDVDSRREVYEVKAGKPQQDNITTNPTGIVTVGDDEGGFLYKFRPKPGVSQIFGKVPLDDEVVIHVRDRSITVGALDDPSLVFERNTMSGMAIGLHLHADGRVVVGSNDLPAGMQLERIGVGT